MCAVTDSVLAVHEFALDKSVMQGCSASLEHAQELVLKDVAGWTAKCLSLNFA